MTDMRRATGCAAALAMLLATADGTERMKTFTLQSGEETRIEMAAGTEFVLRLEANLSTGYSWGLEREPDPELLRLVKTEEEEPPELLLGAPQMQRWTFGALRAGTAKALLAYKRPWEKDAAPLRRHALVVVIR